jgi:hypothetical protein
LPFAAQNSNSKENGENRKGKLLDADGERIGSGVCEQEKGKELLRNIYVYIWALRVQV